MTTIQRYVLWEITKVFLLCLGITVLLMTVGGGVNEGLKKGLPPGVILNMLPYFIPEMLRYTIPGCMLFAVCTAFGRMAASNEITAIKSAGINPMELMWPVLTLAYFLSFFTFWMYDACAAWSRPNLHRVVAESLDDTVYGVLRTQRNFKMSGFSVTVKSVQDRKLISPTFQVAATESQPSIYLEVEEAELKTDPKTGILQLICRDGTVEFGDEGSFEFPDERVIYLDHLNSIELNEDNSSPANLTLKAIPKQIDREKALVKEAKATLQEVTDSADAEILDDAQHNLKHHQKRLFRLQAERQRRLANGFGVFCFVCMGIPVAIWRKSADNVSTFFTCFLPILLLYYPLLVIGEQTAREGTFGSAPVWIANAVLITIGAALIWRVNRN
ncbi:putative permease YjgP/YjgQ family protein [Bremerella volcania]|uniref:Putative permease YjgP/YjgQ family protein n=1 Tax=Bremerella volcania TaxID=2527984 RepID=A0A518C1Q7_9BACT|nr:LptF/LptG family permease [Bremerella volcania]QDU73158.1 putative permease YjgP/YjgQ family protein [Bremerella volcania]